MVTVPKFGKSVVGYVEDIIDVVNVENYDARKPHKQRTPVGRTDESKPSQTKKT